MRQVFGSQLKLDGQFWIKTPNHQANLGFAWGKDPQAHPNPVDSYYKPWIHPMGKAYLLKIEVEIQKYMLLYLAL